MLRNYTVDDAGTSPVTPRYRQGGPWAWRTRSSEKDCPGCLVNPDPAQMMNGTWHDVSNFNDPEAASSVELSFRGTALYIYCALGNFNPEADASSHISLHVDGQTVDSMDWYPEETEPPFLYRQLVLSATGLRDEVHVASVVNASPNSSRELLTVMLFDYAVYTADDGVASSTEPTASSSNPPDAGSSSSSRTSSSHPSASSSETTSSTVTSSPVLPNPTPAITTPTADGQTQSEESGMATVSSLPTPTPPAGNSHTAALGVGLSLGVVALCFILSMLYYLHRRRQQSLARQSELDSRLVTPYSAPSTSMYSDAVHRPFSPGTSYPATSSTHSLLQSPSEPDNAEVLRAQLAMLQQEMRHLRASVSEAPPQYSVGSLPPPASQPNNSPRPRKI